jgi:hypothetical protein
MKKSIKNIKNNKYYYILIIIFVILLFIILFKIINKYNENFENSVDNKIENNYLYPLKGLTIFCEKEGLMPSYMPKVCSIDGKINSYANCKCQDEKGNCKLCYETLEKHKAQSKTVYDSNG